jgi:cell pole-organizing protein PopZ
MDEILASIRKIIESNEATGPGLPANDQGPVHQPGPASGSFYGADRDYLDEEEAEDIHLTIDDDVFPDYDDHADATQQRVMPVLAYPPEAPVEAAMPVAAPAPTAQAAPLSLADVAARVRAASERQSLPREMPAPETRGRDTDLREPALRETAVRTALPADSEQGRKDAVYREPVQREQTYVKPVELEVAASETVRPAAPPVARQAPSMPPAPLRAEPAVAQAPQAQALPTSPMPPIPELMAEAAKAAPSAETRETRETAAILSDAVSEQVSRSFGELALAIDSSPRRSFDEIAEDMLRPMLQEWLDDNLPTLVERLVREEIERVARGPRR